MALLVTGGAGFIGSNFVSYFLEQSSGTTLINLDKLTYAGSKDNLKGVLNHPNHIFVQGDIGNRELVVKLFETYDVNGVLHFAAESHVDNSISGPKAFVETNINGTFNLLEVARAFWMDAPHQPKKGKESARFHHISTDEVYGTLEAEGHFTEDSPYAPNSPYSASKAASDFLVRSYFHTYGLQTVTTNCSNNYGPNQHEEKLIPTIIRKALGGESIPIYGDGSNVRDWLYVKDHCRGIAQVFKAGRPGETYVMGGDCERNNLHIARKICSILDIIRPKNQGSYMEQIAFVDDRPGHDFRYAIDASKIKKELGWEPQENLASGLEKTVQWYLGRGFS